MDNKYFRPAALVRLYPCRKNDQVIFLTSSERLVKNEVDSYAELSFLIGNWYVYDTNFFTGSGVYLNNVQIPKGLRVVVKNLDLLRIGTIPFRFFSDNNNKKLLEAVNGLLNQMPLNEVVSQSKTLSISSVEQVSTLDVSYGTFRDVIGRNLTCPVCWDYFHTPTILGCGHTFCKSCIVKYCAEQMTEDEEQMKGVCQACEVPIEMATINLSIAGIRNYYLQLPFNEQECNEWKQKDEELIEEYGCEVNADSFTRRTLLYLIDVIYDLTISSSELEDSE